MGFTDSNDGADEVWVLMIVLVQRGDFFLFSYEVYNMFIEVYNMFIIAFQTVIQFVLRFTVESDVSS